VSVCTVVGWRVEYAQSTAEGYNLDGNALESTANSVITTNPIRVISNTVSCTPSIVALNLYPRDYCSGSMGHPDLWPWISRVWLNRVYRANNRLKFIENPVWKVSSLVFSPESAQASSSDISPNHCVSLPNSATPAQVLRIEAVKIKLFT